MNIHFSNVNFSSSSGPNSFAGRLANELKLMGHNIVGVNDAYDVFLIFIEPASMPHSNCKIIHRLDGVWFKPDQFYTHNKGIKWAYENSHSVVWISEFNKKMSEHYWGPKPGTVIHNGAPLLAPTSIDPALTSIRDRYERIFVCSASWHGQKRLKANIEFFQKNREYKKDCLLVLGNNPDYIIDDVDIHYLGNCSHNVCMQIYHIADWFIHLAWLDHCPNVVVEALSQGCPVICTDSGGTPEVVGKNGVIINENIPYNFELTDYDLPYDIHVPKIDLPSITVDRTCVDIRTSAESYHEIFKKN